MRKLRIIIPGLILIFLIALGSCASTRISSETQPEFKLSSYRTVVVSAPTKDLKLRERAEKAFAKQLEKQGLTVYLGIEITPPNINYEDGQIGRIYLEEGVEGVFTVELTGFDTTVVDQQPGENKQSMDSGDAYNANLAPKAGRSISISRKRFAVTLWNPYTAEDIWTASAVTTENGWAATRAILDSVSKATAKKFKSDLEEETQ